MMTKPAGRHLMQVRKDVAIRIRASAATKAMLKRAAVLRGQTLPDFILDSARREAEETILDQKLFLLDDAAHERLIAMLDRPATPSAQARLRLRRPPP